VGRIQFSDKTKPRIQIDEPQTRRRLNDADMMQALGAEFIGVVPKGGNLLSAFALRNQLFERLRSSGGRPSLEGADIRTKVPMRKSSWDKLEGIAKAVETESFHPTPSQVASVLLDLAIAKFEFDKVDIEQRAREMVETE
jgi:hypothetical protein